MARVLRLSSRLSTPEISQTGAFLFATVGAWTTERGNRSCRRYKQVGAAQNTSGPAWGSHVREMLLPVPQLP